MSGCQGSCANGQGLQGTPFQCVRRAGGPEKRGSLRTLCVLHTLPGDKRATSGCPRHLRLWNGQRPGALAP